MTTNDRGRINSRELPPAPGSVMWMPKQDDRPQRGWWAPGEYLNLCRRCNDYFIGDKRAGICADCAYPAMTCTNWRCYKQALWWMEAGDSRQTTLNGFLVVKIKGWYCPKCGNCYGSYFPPKPDGAHTDKG